jgi:MinD superfamily P-loop ATPase
LFHAALFPAQENSGKLVSLIKQQAVLLAQQQPVDLILVDGPPGIGCPVISTVTGADLALIVAEPTASGVHDMRRVLETVSHFGIPALVCINKADIYPQGAKQIETFCEEREIVVVGKIPFDKSVTESMVAGHSVTKAYPNSPASVAMKAAWSQVMLHLDGVT